MEDPENIDPYGPQNHPLRPIEPGRELQNKLRLIRSIKSEEELRGWINCIEFTRRPHFPGERAALLEKAKELGVKL